MSKKKYYFENEDSEFVYTKEYFIENEISEVIEAIPDRLDSEMMFCKYYAEFGETGNCGKVCDHYDPCNGKNGKCKYYSKNCFVPGKKINLNTIKK